MIDGKAIEPHRLGLGNITTVIIVGVLIYLLYGDITQRTADRWYRSNMNQWRDSLKESNPTLIIPELPPPVING